MRGMLSAAGQAQCASWATGKHSTEHQGQVCQAFQSCCVMNPATSVCCCCRHQLPPQLQARQFDWVVITSPESAAVFLEGWQVAGKPQVIPLIVSEFAGHTCLLMWFPYCPGFREACTRVYIPG